MGSRRPEDRLCANLLYTRPLPYPKTPLSQLLKDIPESDIINIALDLAVRYFKQIKRLGREKSKIGDLITAGVPRKNIIPQKCGLCNQRVLDDAYARYKKLDPKRYALRVLQSACRLLGCPGDQQGVWAVPAHARVIKYTRPQRSNLALKPMKAS
jgi:hypothetical protein